jgi:hypothetical protein
MNRQGNAIFRFGLKPAKILKAVIYTAITAGIGTIYLFTALEAFYICKTKKAFACWEKWQV